MFGLFKFFAFFFLCRGDSWGLFAIEAIKAGAYDCLLRPVDEAELAEVVENALADSTTHASFSGRAARSQATQIVFTFKNSRMP